MPAARNVGKLVVNDVVGDLMTAPVFWYTRGAIDAARYCLDLVKRQWLTLGVGVWIKNLFVPMYGARDFAGVIISFFVRFFQIIARCIALAIWAAGVAVLFVLYLVAPAFILFELFKQIVGLL
jgi:hypothetical protein